MFKQFKLVASLAITAMLAACGCGGGEDSDNSSVSVNNSLKNMRGPTTFVIIKQRKSLPTH